MDLFGPNFRRVREAQNKAFIIREEDGLYLALCDSATLFQAEQSFPGMKKEPKNWRSVGGL